MADPIRVLYLIGQFPAINHSYLLAEVRHLRSLGFEVSVVSVRPPDRPPEKLTRPEREEAARTYYVKSVPEMEVVFHNVSELFRRPLPYLRGLFFALRLAGNSARRAAYHLAYFAEAILLGRHMRRIGVAHVHASFSATVALIAARTFPVTMSFGVYGSGELQNPAETQLAERIAGAGFVRSISRFGRGQMILSCDRSQWSKLVYAPLGIDPSEFVPAPGRSVSSEAHILCVGRLAPEKGQSLLLEALAALRSEGRTVTLRLVGDGPDRNFLEGRTRGIRNLVQRGIRRLGRSGSPHGALCRDGCFCLAQFGRRHPNGFDGSHGNADTCAWRLASLAFPELIEHGVSGMLFAVADVQDLCNQMRKLLQSRDLCAQMGKEARARVLRDYDMARNTAHFGALMTEKLRVKPL